MSKVYATESEAISEVKFCNSAEHRLSEQEITKGRVPCQKCKNRGFMYTHTYNEFGWYIATRNCDCLHIASQTHNLNNSGLADLAQRFTFDSFIAKTKWQSTMKDKANEFLNSVLFGGDNWFLMLGQSGSGKTHICTAVCNELIKKGFSVKYLRWGVEGKRLKNSVNTPEYAVEIDNIMRHKAIYIDDLFKRKSGAEVTDGDIKLAFEIIDTAIAKRKILIVSSEEFTDGLCAIDEATGGRLKQNAGDYICELNGTEKNQRIFT